jgi:glucokinase
VTKANFILAVDLGGTKTATAVVTSNGTLLSHRQEPTCQNGPREGIEQLVHLAKAAVQGAGLKMSDVTCAGVGVPAVLEPDTDRVIWAPKLNGWRDVDLCTPLREALGIPVYAEYDGHTTVLGEWWLGVGQGFRSVVALIIGTGIGGGMILDGKLYRGFNRLAGAAGWMALTSEAEVQTERARSIGFWDALASGEGLAAYAKTMMREHPESSLAELDSSGEVTAAQVFLAGEAGDKLAEQILNTVAGWLGLGIANLVSLLNPEIVILCGGVGSHCERLLPRIRQVVLQWSQPISAQAVKIAVSQLGEEAGLYGAAWGAWQRWQQKAKKEKPYD